METIKICEIGSLIGYADTTPHEYGTEYNTYFIVGERKIYCGRQYSEDLAKSALMKSIHDYIQDLSQNKRFHVK